MTAPSPRPAAGDRYAQCTDDCTTDCGACKGSGRPAAPDTTGELRDVLMGPVRDWQERHRQGSFVTTPDEFVNAILALPALRDLLAERDTLAAKVQAGLALAAGYAVMGRSLHSVPHAETFAEVASDLHRALDAPTTGGGE